MTPKVNDNREVQQQNPATAAHHTDLIHHQSIWPALTTPIDCYATRSHRGDRRHARGEQFAADHAPAHRLRHTMTVIPGPVTDSVLGLLVARPGRVDVSGSSQAATSDAMRVIDQ